MPVTTTSSAWSPGAGMGLPSDMRSAFLDLAGRGVDADDAGASLAGLLRHRLLDRGRGALSDARHHRDLGDGRLAQLLQGAEVLEQRLAAYLTQPRYAV